VGESALLSLGSFVGAQSTFVSSWKYTYLRIATMLSSNTVERDEYRFVNED